MAIPKSITKESILKAVEYIDKNDVPSHNHSVIYSLIVNGKPYPPKYVVAVANHLSNDAEISVKGYNAVEAKNFLKSLAFTVETKQEKYTLTITKDTVTSTDTEFSLDNLGYGDYFSPLDVAFKGIDGEEIRRKRDKGERKSSNQTIARLAMQIFEQNIANLSVQEKHSFPICQYTLTSEIIRGIFASVEEFRNYKNSIEYAIYTYQNNKQFVIYCWNIFSTILFAQECLKRFGTDGDKFILTYREKADKENEPTPVPSDEGKSPSTGGVFANPYSNKLLESKNIVFRGAPGTGKTYLAREIATDIISNGYYSDYTSLTDTQKTQIEFVQFHPSYDYTDFVEGLRPVTTENGSVGFKLQDGVFKKFVARAIKNLENSQKSIEVIGKEFTAKEKISNFLENIILGENEYEIARGTKFVIEDIDESNLHISIPENAVSKSLKLKISDIQKMLESDHKFTQVKDITSFFGKQNATQNYSYYLTLFNEINKYANATSKVDVKQEELKPFIFIIDEINRGEISKIFGELFFSIDPGYRGKSGEVSTQYANLHEDGDGKFYIPENLYIIGTMNDIDRSVDSFDFAMRRRFRFIEIKAEDCLEMLDALNDKKDETALRMKALNDEISKVEGLNENYHIGASYFLKLAEISADILWEDYIEPLLREYVRGMHDEIDIMQKFADAYGYIKPSTGDSDDNIQG